MPVNHNSIDVPLHGGLFHSTCIMIAKYVCWKKGYKLKNPDAFAQMYKCPGIPDIYLEYEYKAKDDFGRTRTMRQSVCIEIETHLTKASSDKKYEQFYRPGMHEPIIIDVGTGFLEFKKKQKDKGVEYSTDIDCIAEYIENRLVL